jgi:hypothetical protein
MRIPDHPTLIRRQLDSRLKQLVPTGSVLAASGGEPALLAMAGGGLGRRRGPEDADPPGQQLRAGGCGACCRFRPYSPRLCCDPLRACESFVKCTLNSRSDVLLTSKSHKALQRMPAR